MNYPSGGFPAQGPQQPQQQGGQYYPQQQQRAGMKMDIGTILHLVIAFFGLLILFFGFIDFGSAFGGAVSAYEMFYGWIPALYLTAGLLALLGVLPGDAKPGALPAIVSLATTFALLFTTFEGPSLEAGGILILIVGILQTLGAVAAYLISEKVIKIPAGGQPQQFGQPGYGQAQGFGGPQPQQQQYGQQGGQQQAQQPTTYTGHQGQFSQQPPQNG
ncbi:DUF5336 domain-containing protein [Thermocrispum municipale]|jgi:hypothetical protein|uniref:DUF5336 domain-containing protein n=1 Tax=Thermocrispum municipale TaxID=37926 RepID=UPI0004207924|nr:DUF5336 domain-containing protein [Thermocrispum municipale]